MGAPPLYLAVTVVAVCLLLWAEARERRAGAGAAKLLASTGFVGFALALGAADTAYGRTVLLALGSCWLGDALLIPRGARAAFLAGLVAFLLGHLAFGVGFLQLGRATVWMIAAGLASAAAALLVARWLDPHLSGAMRHAVSVYVLVISGMLVCAAGASGATGRLAPLVGAVAFAVSDLSVVRQRFVKASFRNKAWGLPLYYAAQLVLATTVAPSL